MSLALSTDVVFYLNGTRQILKAPPPDLMLIDWLRSPDVRLTGPKKPCGQGGCGGCAVILSHWDEATGRPVHESINSCLRPVAAVNGLAVTTIEGTGSVRGEMNKVAYRLAANNGTQCGYCSNGWVMTMTGFLANDPANRTKRDIEGLFDGNLCRCTGYRTILDGMKTFASDWTPEDQAALMKCKIDPAFSPKSVSKAVTVPFPEGARAPVRPLHYQQDDKIWITAQSIDDVLGAIADFPDARLVNGNTSFGIYKQETLEAKAYIDIRGVHELCDLKLEAGYLVAGAGVTYGRLLTFFGTDHRDGPGVLSLLDLMARRTAGGLVRNAATLGGNTMLVLHHIHEGEPFPSDMATALTASGAQVDFVMLADGQPASLPITDLVARCLDEPAFAGSILLVRYRIPETGAGAYWAQKAALREVNSHSIVNAGTRFDLEPRSNGAPVVRSVNVVFGGIAPFPWEPAKTVAYLTGKPLDPATIDDALALLRDEVAAELAAWAKRLVDCPSEGFTNEYRIQLAQTYLFKAILNAVGVYAPGSLPADLKSASHNYWGNWPVSKGRQTYQTERYKEPLSEPYIKLMALYQAQGEVRYTHEIPPVPKTQFAALVGSDKAVGSYHFVSPDTGGQLDAAALNDLLIAKFPGVSRLVTSTDISPDGAPLTGFGNDQPIFLEPGGDIMFAGQSIALVLANSERLAQQAAAFVNASCLAYENPNGLTPVLTIEDAQALNWIFPDCPATASWVAHIWKVTRPNTSIAWQIQHPDGKWGNSLGNSEVDGVACQIVSSCQKAGGQLHFYMETQSDVVHPQDDGTILIYASTQSPKGVQDSAATALGLARNEIAVVVRQLGGGYGGKTVQSPIPANIAAVASQAVNGPVHLALERERDSALIGRRHPFSGQVQIAANLGQADPNDKGLFVGLAGDLLGDGGAFYDCSFVVSDCIQLRVDNAYYFPNYQTTIDVCRTNTAPNTAYRAFGLIQGNMMLENAIEDMAIALDMDPGDLRQKNLYALGQTTPGGQPLTYCYMKEVWDYTVNKSDYANRKKAVDAYNAQNKWRKRGISLLPVKYGSGYNLVMLEQTTALISVYEADGTILVQQGGVDMGQGMITKIAQVAAYSLNVPLEIVRIENCDTRVIANPSSTGASTGTQYNGAAVKAACDTLKERLETFMTGVRADKGDAYCKDHNLDYWNYNNGWNSEVNGTTIWANIIAAAFSERVNLQVQSKAQIKGGTGNVPNVSFKPYDAQPRGTGIQIDPNGPFREAVNQYVGFTFNAACAEVEVDILTGETKILRVDIVYDMGKSLNPAIDIGQVEGAFMQGVGYVLTENMVFNTDGPDIGVMTTDNTWRYKPPAVSTVPIDLNVSLFPRELAANVPENPNTLFSSKEVGEPPLVLANTVFFAVKAAIRASRLERGLSPYFEMDAPATVQTVRGAAEIASPAW